MTCLVPQIFSGPSTPGVGPDAVMIETQQRRYTTQALDTPGTGALMTSRIQAVIAAVRSASSLDWDGQGAHPVNTDSARHAARFLALLPAHYPAPDVGVDPDGEVSIEWYASAERIFSVSVAPSGELHYAGRFGKSRVRGKEAVTTAASSSLLCSYIERVAPRT